MSRVTAESAIRRTKLLALAAALALIAPTAFAETGITNIISGVSSNISGGYMVGTNGAFNVLIITNAGSLSDTTGTIGNSASASNNAVIVTGSSSRWNNSAQLYVGYSGTFNQLTISNSGRVDAGDASYIGYNSSASNNAVLVTGAGSLWNSGRLSLGYFGNSSFNQLTIANSGRVISVNSIIYCQSNAVLVTGAGSVWSNGQLEVGSYGSRDNKLTITNGGNVFSAGGFIGISGGTNNSVIVTGTGSVWNATSSPTFNLGVGYEGTSNQMTIANGGAVFSANSYIGYSSVSSSNTVLVTDAGSVWSNSGTLYVGNYGAGNKLTVTNGGSVLNGDSYIGYYSGANSNAVIIAGAGSVWSNSSYLCVGRSGLGNQLTITNGGTVYSSTASIGDSSNSNRVLVTGAGSVWSNSSFLYVGNSGSGNILTITNSGTVVASNVVIGNSASTANSVTISGGKLYATNIASNGSLDIRRGTLALNTGTVVVNQLYLTNNASSVMTFSAGLLQSGGSTVSNGVTFAVGDGTQSATLDLLGGTHSFASGLRISTNGNLIGNASIIGSVTNFGFIAPGHSVGTISITGGLTLAGSSELDFEITGPSTNDHLDITGILVASGALKVAFANGYTGNHGDTFDLFSFGAVSGTFTQTNLPTLSPGLEWNTSKLYTLGDIEIVPEPGIGALLAVGIAVLRRRRRNHGLHG